MSEIVLLSEDEVAQRLRRSVAMVQELLLSGELAFLPGRPVLIPEDALNAYIAGRLRHGLPSCDQSRSLDGGAEPSNSKSALDLDYEEIGEVFDELERLFPEGTYCTPTIKRLLEPHRDRPNIAEARKRARLAQLVEEQRLANPKIQKASQRKATEEGKRRAAAKKRRNAAKTRQARPLARQPKTP